MSVEVLAIRKCALIDDIYFLQELNIEEMLVIGRKGSRDTT